MPRTITSARQSQVVGLTLRRRREALGLTQAEVAERLDVAPAYVQRVESGGANLTVGQLARFAEALEAVAQVHLEPMRERDEMLDRLTSL